MKTHQSRQFRRQMSSVIYRLWPCAIAALVLAGCGQASNKISGTDNAGSTQAHFQLISDPQDGWQRVATADGNVSVEFPTSSAGEETVTEIKGVDGQMFSVLCNVTNKNINLRLSYNQTPPEAVGMSSTQQVEQVANSMKQNGFTIASLNAVSGPGEVFQIVADKAEGQQRFVMRIAIRNGVMYRAIATSTREFNADPAVATFINSFQCKP